MAKTTQSRRASEIAKSSGQKTSQPFNYSREQLQKPEQSVKPVEPAPAIAPAPKTRKLSYKEQRELEALPDLITRLEAEQQEASALLADGSLYAIDNARAMKLAARSAQIDEELLAAMERWEALGA